MDLALAGDHVDLTNREECMEILPQKAAVVTGAARGVSRATAIAPGRSGYAVAVVDLK